MHYLLRVLILFLLLFSPCVVGCSSQVSESDAEKIEAENKADESANSGEEADDGKAKRNADDE